MASDEYVNDRSNLGVIVDQNLKIKPSQKLRDFVKENSDLRSGQEYFMVTEITDLWKSLSSSINSDPTKEKVYLNELLIGSDIIPPSLEIPARNPVLEKRITKLRNTLAQKEYKRMTKDVDFTNRYKPEDSVGQQMKEINTGLIGVIQFVVSVAAAFAFGFMGVEPFIGVTFELAVKLLLGIIFALIVGCAELYFLAVNLDLSESPPPPGPFIKKMQ